MLSLLGKGDSDVCKGHNTEKKRIVGYNLKRTQEKKRWWLSVGHEGNLDKTGEQTR